MKKYYWNLLTIMMMVITASFGLISCNDDDDNEKSYKSNIVGSWLLSDDEFILTFYADGTGLAQEFHYENWPDKSGNKIISDEWPISWIYDEKNSKLTIIGYDGEDDVTIFYVYTLQDDYLVISDTGGRFGKETYIRM